MFVCTLDKEPPIAALHGNGEFIYSVAIGFDDDTDHVFSLMLIFAPLAAYGDGTGYELVFRIVESSLDGTYVYDYNDGAETKRFLSEQGDRKDVIDLILYLVESHIDEMKPRKVEMTTYAENLPEAALQKYHKIAALFRHKGYQAGPADPWCGRWIWMMRLP